MRRPLLIVLTTLMMLVVGCDDDPPSSALSDTASPGIARSPIAPDPNAPDPTAPGRANPAGNIDQPNDRSAPWRRVNELLASGASPNSVDSLGIPLLHTATLEQANDAVELLLERGADPNLPDAQLGWTALHWSASVGDVECVRLLLDKGAKVDTADQHGRTVAHVAAGNVNPDVLQVLLQHGASLAARDHHGATPLHAAIRAGQTSVVAWLLNHGAPIDARDAAGRTPFDLAELLDRGDLASLIRTAMKRQVAG